MQKGIFVVWEGIDGSGKGTVISEIKKFIIKKGIPENQIIVTAEPTGGFYGKKVRELLNTHVNPDVNAQQFLDLYVADREEHLRKEIVPALKEGKIILCDRFKYSTFVYQLLQGIELEKINELHRGMLIPDLVFILDLPVDVALQRIESDSKRSKKEVFEKKEFLEKVRQGFLSLKEIFPDENIHIVDSSKNISEVTKEIGYILWAKIKDL
ncbi:MAG: dTMP kinase [Candidatus Diapherotrites archaeon]|uniref:Probable thymidylate kinase n=1 Tax=Candidatus Iainarchaeum sp. TaxID=3101447 RepID=A0A2D6LQ73_9ARCH|nr:dTMP kinase [Candidatus Diapherotrites archaeon]|tara:strand:+ start:29520 stop:30152 length:633 start_codon:yes stop_codon:yes gene_type:complete